MIFNAYCPVVRSTSTSLSRLLLWAAAISSLLLAGCAGVINRVELDPATPMVCNDAHAVCGIESNHEVTFKVWGRGKCGSVGLNFGDGTPVVFSGPVDFGDQGTTPWEVKHTYSFSSWPGAKTVHAYSAQNCSGLATLPQNILHKNLNSPGYRADFWLAFFQPGAQACGHDSLSTYEHLYSSPVPPRPQVTVPPLRPNSRVYVTTNPDPAIKINFGCVFSGCIYDANGEPNSSAPANYPFPNLRKYSLVFRVGGQVVQGGTSMNFTAASGGTLEVCVNDDNWSDNTGAWGIKFIVDETQSP